MQPISEFTAGEKLVLATLGAIADLGDADDAALSGAAAARRAREAPNRRIRGSFLRSLLAGEFGPPPASLTVIGGWVDGVVDLSRMAVAAPLTFTSCWWDGGLQGFESTLSNLQLNTCTVLGALDLRATEATGSLTMNRCWVRVPSTVTGPAINLVRAQVSGDVSMHDMRITARAGIAVDASHAKVTGVISLAGTITSKSPVVAVRFAHTRSGGDLTVRGAIFAEVQPVTTAEVVRPSGVALDLANAHVDGDLVLTGVWAHTSGSTAVVATGAHVGQSFVLTGAVLGARDRALDAQHLTVRQSAQLMGLRASAKRMEALSFAHAEVSGTLSLDGAQLRSDDSAALALSHTTVGARVSLRQSVLTGKSVAARLRYLDVGESVEGADMVASATDVEITNTKIAGDVKLPSVSALVREGTALVLKSVRIGGDLDLRGSPSEVASEVESRTSDRHLSHSVDLQSVDIRGYLHVEGLPAAGASDGERWNIRDVTYTADPYGPALPQSADRLAVLIAFLRYGTTEYVAQPYQFVASQARAAGHHDDAERIMMAQRRHQLASPAGRGSGTSVGRKVWGFVTRITVGYGYRSWYALAWLAGTFAVTAVLALTLGADHLGALEEGDVPTMVDCSAAGRWAFAALISIPPLSAVTEPVCVPLNGVAEALSYAIQILGWAFTTLFVAGFTGIIRRA